MRPYPPPYDDMTAGRPARIGLRGAGLLGARLLTKDLAFTAAERSAFGLEGLLPDRVLTIEEELTLELEHIRRKSDDLERYIGLAALQDRNATLYYRLLAENVHEFLPIVYTPTVGRACQEFSHIVRRTRGLWITPDDVDRIPDILAHSPYPEVRLIVVTDNERILGLGDQGAGGMAIPIGKLALYTAACGIHPSVTLPVSLDVGTDNETLLADPLYLGYRAPRLRGAAYDALIEAFVEGVMAAWPGCLIQWEDFKQHIALRLLDRYRHRVPSFNDDNQGTAAVVLAGVLAGLGHLGRPIREERFVIAGAGAAGIGVARLLGVALHDAGASADDVRRAIALVDSHGLVHAGRTDLEEDKRALARPRALLDADGFVADALAGQAPDLVSTIATLRPTVLVGTTAAAGTFSEAAIRTLVDGLPTGLRPIVLPLSNPTSKVEATPQDVLAWTDGRALVATGSPFEPVAMPDGRVREVGQANNVFIFPGVGLGALVAEARQITDRMFLVAAQTLAAEVRPERLAVGALYPPVDALRSVSRSLAIAVAECAIADGVAGLPPGTDVAAAVDAAMWWPAYVPYLPS